MNINRRSLLRSTAIGAAAAVASPFVVRDLHAEDMIKVVGIHDASGGLDIYGKPMVATLGLAVDEINAARRPARQADRADQLRSAVQHPALHAVRHRGRDQGPGRRGAWRHHLGVARGHPADLRKRYETLYFYNTQYEGGVCDRNIFCTGVDAGADCREAGAPHHEEVGQEDLHRRRRLQLRPDHRQVGAALRAGQWRRGRPDRFLPARRHRLRRRPSRRSRRPSPTSSCRSWSAARTSRSTGNGPRPA